MLRLSNIESYLKFDVEKEINLLSIINKIVLIPEFFNLKISPPSEIISCSYKRLNFVFKDLFSVSETIILNFMFLFSTSINKFLKSFSKNKFGTIKSIEVLELFIKLIKLL